MKETPTETEHKCNWKEGYYGWECECGEMIPYGCEPWMPTDDEIHDMIMRARFQEARNN